MVDRARLVAASIKIWGRRFVSSQSAATAVEYGFMLTFIAVGLIVAMRTIGVSLSETFQYFADMFTPPGG
jgi:Flp pilus assembly pilin Flp